VSGTWTGCGSRLWVPAVGPGNDDALKIN
jgi:hypothetical protein